MTIPVKECKSYDPWLVVLCVVLSVALAGFVFLAVRNATPFTCETSEFIDDNRIKCTRIIERGE